MTCTVMGVLNVTPDSFYDGGRYLAPEAAIARGRAMVEEGAGLLDIGGESTRPGADPVDLAEELRRVLPVVEALAPRARVSIDTMKPEVAIAAVEAGATLINDVSGALAPVAAKCGVGVILMHMLGTPKTMQRSPHYDDVVTEVGEFLAGRAEEAHRLGVEEVYVDPGIGFGKRIGDNLALLRALPDLVAAGTPVVVGVSRKSFLGLISAGPDRRDLEVEERFEASLAAATWAMSCGVAIVRVHDVAPSAMASALVGDAPVPPWPGALR